MAGDAYADRVRRGLALERPDDTIESVTNTVIQELVAFDPSISLRKTGYFNHSFIPDLVATWPKDSSSDERFVYLKFNADVRDFIDDVRLVQDSRPIVFKLGPNDESDRAATQIDDLSVGGDTLVTDPAGLEEFITRSGSDFVKLVSAALSQGGRGYLDEESGEEVAVALDAGFFGARTLEVAKTRSATDLVAKLLTAKYASRVGRLMQAIWIGSGGTASTYPGEVDLGSDLSDDALHFLLTFDGIEDPGFWRRIAQWTSVEQLGRLELPNGSLNLQRLIRSGSADLWARSCRVLQVPQESLLEQYSGESFTWRVERDLLALRGPSFVAYLSEFAERTTRIGPPDRDGVSIEELQRKPSTFVVHEADLVANEQHLNYVVQAKRDIRTGEVLARLAATLGKSAVVRRVSASRDDSPSLQCDFTTNTANGITRSKPALRDAVRIALLAFEDLPESMHLKLDDLLGVEEVEKGTLW